ncbi:MAG: GGDEF domain-containing protein [Betaproteobacteria bacterium]|nr:GGDEF domain-containing protein [Betaproteobacteria bacterium]
MIDAPTLFVVLVVTNLVLAASLWIGTGRTRRDGIGPWIAGLVLQAGSFAVFAMRGDSPNPFNVVAANALLAAAVACAAWALASFRHMSLPLAAPLAYVGLMIAVTAGTVDTPAARMFFGSLVLACGMGGVAALAAKPLADVTGSTRGLLVGSYALGALSLVTRAVGALADPQATGAHASFYLTMPLLAGYATVLGASVAFLLMQTERADFTAKLLASTDPLTGAYNRRTFLELMEKELSRARRFDTPLSLVMLDLDHFKRVNDTHGHLVGDRVLQRFADIVRGELRKEDVLFRYGGEEFCVLVPDVAGAGAVTLADRIRTVVERQPFRIDGQEIPVTTSAGVAARIEEGPEDVDRLVNRADEALYIAKRRGRNRVASVALGTRVA